MIIIFITITPACWVIKHTYFETKDKELFHLQEKKMLYHTPTELMPPFTPPSNIKKTLQKLLKVLKST